MHKGWLSTSRRPAICLSMWTGATVSSDYVWLLSWLHKLLSWVWVGRDSNIKCAFVSCIVTTFYNRAKPTRLTTSGYVSRKWKFFWIWRPCYTNQNKSNERFVVCSIQRNTRPAPRYNNKILWVSQSINQSINQSLFAQICNKMTIVVQSTPWAGQQGSQWH